LFLDVEQLQQKFNAIFKGQCCTIVIYVGFIDAEEIKEMFLPVCRRVTEIKSGMDSIKEALQHFQNFEEIKCHVASTKRCLQDAPQLLNCDQLSKAITEYEENSKPVKNIILCIEDGLKHIKNRYKELNTKENIYQDDKNAFETTMKLIESSIDIINGAIVYASSGNLFEAIRGGMHVIQSALKEMELEFAIFQKCILGYRNYGNNGTSPLVLSLSPEEQKALMYKHAQQPLRWTDSEQVQSKVSNFLKGHQPFFFYRNRRYSNASPATPVSSVVNVVCREMYWDHYFLVVGDDSGLKEELKQDIEFVASKAQLDDFEIKRLYDQLAASDNGFSKSVIYGTQAVFTCLIFPNSDEIKELLAERMTLNPGNTFTIIYSGHALCDGSWVLPEGDSFDASDLMEVIDKAFSDATHIPAIKIVLNCCYGWAFANEVEEANFDNIIKAIKCKKIDQLKDISDEQLKDMLTGEYGSSVINNIDIVDIFLEIYENTLSDYKNNPFTVRILKNNLDISFITFSIGPLLAEGIFKRFYKIQPCIKLSELDWSRIRKRSPLKERDPVPNSKPSDPQLIVFPAHRGDSTLFRWHNFNMLVDGGLLTDPPCFWETVRRLPNDQKLDIVVVTHFDADHISGILRLFEEDNLHINIGKLYTVGPPPAKRSAKQGADLWDKAKGKTVVKNLITNEQEAIISHQFPNGDDVKIFMITPSRGDLQKALDILPCRRSTESEIANAASASLLIKCAMQRESNQEYRYALLTGDAPGNTIITRLAATHEVARIPTQQPEGQEHPTYRFDYIDMPHHGSASETTAPQDFLARVNAQLCVVSTNSKNYNHPDADTVTELRNALPIRIKKVLFTYKAVREFKYKTKQKKRNLSDEFGQNNIYCKFAPNNIDRKDAQSCIKVNLYSREYEFLNNDNIIN